MITASPENPVNQSHRPRRWFRRLLLLLFIGIPALYGLFVLVLFLLAETYFAPAPWIGTHFAPDYTEEGFDQIQYGDTKERVLDLIGEPLYHDKCGYRECEPQVWVYSEDLSCCVDFAWLYRDIGFDEVGKVRFITRTIYYD